MKQVPAFNPADYEAGWRERWEREKVYEVDNPLNAGKPKYYCLDMFPYPSGEGLHVGHWRGYVLSDVWVRYKLLQGYNVLHPMGWDNFGLPAENDAIKKGIHPRESTRKNIDNMRRQLREIGCAYDWSKELDTTHPAYYKWTQFIFLKMFERGLAYQEYMPVNWCNHCNVVLANEEVAGGQCERCGGEDIEKRKIKQWMLKITDYAEDLLSDLDDLEWSDKVKEMQRNWIGKSTGASVEFAADNAEQTPITVFTTRPDTLFGATFMVLAPESPLVDKLTAPQQRQAVKDYVARVQTMSSVDRQADKDKTGVFIGACAVNPVNGERIPIYISSYVLMDYGTGAIMAVPAHDERDFAFATKYGIPIREVIYSEQAARNPDGSLREAWTGDGVNVNSDYLDGLQVEAAKQAVIQKLQAAGKSEETVNYKLRDWIFARQRYWGEPIPVVYCDHCGVVAVPYDQLPVELPEVKSYKPSSDGTSPLAAMTDWVNTTCPQCGGPAKRETDTMPQWAGSSWYFLRYPDRDNQEAFASRESLESWLPVDMYVGGIEHAVLHLLYARFWTKVLYDGKLVPFKEPFTRLFNQGMVIRRAHRCNTCNRWVYDEEIDFSQKEGARTCPTCRHTLEVTLEKMSKSKGNGVSPDPLVARYGTDALRLYELFAGDPALDSEWNDDGIRACYNFLKKAWTFLHTATPAAQSSPAALKAINKLAHNVEQRMLSFKFNTAVSAMMEFVNEAAGIPDEFAREDLENFVVVLSPFAPHLAEELWHGLLGQRDHVFHRAFPKVDKEKLLDDTVEYVVQLNGKGRMKFTAPTGADKGAVFAALGQDAKYQEMLAGKTVQKEIFVPGRLINIVAK